MLTGLALGFYFSWREALVCMGCLPFAIFNQVILIKLQESLSVKSDQVAKEANLLAGDVILNYRTVVSFGYEDVIVKDYESLLQNIEKATIRKNHEIAFAFGFS